MPNSEGSLVRLIVPIVIGGLITFGATTFYTDYWKKPDIFFRYDLSASSLHRDALEFRNVGSMPADNLRITIIPEPPNVINFTMGRHSQNTTLIQDGDSWIMETQKFPTGARISVYSYLSK